MYNPRTIRIVAIIIIAALVLSTLVASLGWLFY
ncbi:stressosome-associated protein Prli42 [Paenibacillus sp. GCM10023252]